MAEIRSLRVTDIRCQCGAGPGEDCITDGRTSPHPSRIDEHAALAAAGWQWQEVDPREVEVARFFTLCCARVRSPDGSSWFCSREDGHDGDHHGVCRSELPMAVNDFGPRQAKRRRW